MSPAGRRPADTERDDPAKRDVQADRPGEDECVQPGAESGRADRPEDKCNNSKHRAEAQAGHTRTHESGGRGRSNEQPNTPREPPADVGERRRVVGKVRLSRHCFDQSTSVVADGGGTVGTDTVMSDGGPRYTHVARRWSRTYKRLPDSAGAAQHMPPPVSICTRASSSYRSGFARARIAIPFSVHRISFPSAASGVA